MWSLIRKIYCNFSRSRSFFIPKYLFHVHYERNTSVIITLDLSKLSELWITLETLITYLRQRIKECVKEANKTNSRVKEKLKKSIHDRINSNIVSNFYFIGLLDMGKLYKFRQYHFLPSPPVSFSKNLANTNKFSAQTKFSKNKLASCEQSE